MPRIRSLQDFNLYPEDHWIYCGEVRWLQFRDGWDEPKRFMQVRATSGDYPEINDQLLATKLMLA